MFFGIVPPASVMTHRATDLYVVADTVLPPRRSTRVRVSGDRGPPGEEMPIPMLQVSWGPAPRSVPADLTRARAPPLPSSSWSKLEAGPKRGSPSATSRPSNALVPPASRALPCGVRTGSQTGERTVDRGPPTLVLPPVVGTSRSSLRLNRPPLSAGMDGRFRRTGPTPLVWTAGSATQRIVPKRNPGASPPFWGAAPHLC